MGVVCSPGDMNGGIGADRRMVDSTRTFDFRAELIPSCIKAAAIELLAREFHVRPRFELRSPLPSEVACWPPKGFVAFNSIPFKNGVRLPLHPFFRNVIESYDVAPAQIVPNGYNHMMGMLLVWHDLRFGEPSLREWHALYKIVEVTRNPGFYYFTRWPGGFFALILGCTSSSGRWKPRWFWMASRTGVESGGDIKPHSFMRARVHDKHCPSGIELQHIDRAFKVPKADRQFEALRDERHVSALKMPRLNVNTLRVKELIEKAAEPEHVVVTDATSDPSTGSGDRHSLDLRPHGKLRKVSRTLIPTPISRLVVEPPPTSGGRRVLVQFGSRDENTGVASGFVGESGAGVASMDTTPSDASDIAWAALKSEMVEVDVDSLALANIDTQISHAFNHSVQSAVAMACVRASLGSKSLKISELEEEVSKLKAKADAASHRKALADEKVRRIEGDFAKLKERVKIVELEKSGLECELVAFKTELDAARKGEGMDLCALADSEIFKPVRDVIKEALDGQLVKMIRGKYPDLDLSFVFSKDGDAAPDAGDDATGAP